MKSRPLQIGVVGSAADIPYETNLANLADALGEEIAKAGATLIYGAERDVDSLSSCAARAAKRSCGSVIAVTYGKGTNGFDTGVDVLIVTGMERGGGREFVFVNSCDVLIALCGGSGTLTEIAIAYQANIPVIALAGTGGWSEKLIGTYLDARQRVQVMPAKTPEEAVRIAVQATKRYMEQQSSQTIGIH